MDSNTISAWSTVILVFVTGVYVILTYFLLNETQKARKIKAIEKKLEEFYYPLKHEIFMCKSETYGNDTKYRVSHAPFIERLYLCQNDHIRYILEQFLDPQSTINEKDFTDLQRWVKKDTEDLVKELDSLQGITQKIPVMYGRGGRRA